MITRVTGKNQVTIPAEIARREGLASGTRLEWRSTEREHIIEIRVLPDPAVIAAGLRGTGRQKGSKRGSAVRRLVDERIRDDRAEHEG